MITHPSLAAIGGIVHGFGTRDDDMGEHFAACWPRRAVQHERHGTRIAVVERAGEDCGEADGMVTQVPGALLAIATADCAPVLLARRDGRAVAALHVGWRGALAGIVPRFGALLAARADAPRDWVAAVGPTAAPCCYEVGQDVIERLGAAYAIDRAVLAPRPRRLDLAALVRWQLGALGIGTLAAASPCTICSLAGGGEAGRFAFHSYRRDQATRRLGIDVQWSAVAIAPDRQ